MEDNGERQTDRERERERERESNRESNVFCSQLRFHCISSYKTQFIYKWVEARFQYTRYYISVPLALRKEWNLNEAVMMHHCMLFSFWQKQNTIQCDINTLLHDLSIIWLTLWGNVHNIFMETTINQLHLCIKPFYSNTFCKNVYLHYFSLKIWLYAFDHLNFSFSLSLISLTHHCTTKHIQSIEKTRIIFLPKLN